MWAMLAVSAIQAGVGLYQGYQAKQTAAENAELMRTEADLQRRSIYDEATRFRDQGEAFLGSQRAGIAASGVKMEGSPLAAMRESEAGLSQDVGRIRQSGDLAQQTGYNQAGQLQKQGQDAFTASAIGAGASFMSSLGNYGIQKGWFNNSSENPYQNQWNSQNWSKG